jgi:hypothetical protein
MERGLADGIEQVILVLQLLFGVWDLEFATWDLCLAFVPHP